EIQIAGMEVSTRTLQLVTRAGVNSAGKAELSVVGDIERVIKIARLDYRQHRPKNFFLRQTGVRRDIGDDGWLNVIAFSGLSCTAAAMNQPAFLFADLNIIQNILHGFFIDHRPHGLVLCGIANSNLADAVFQALQEHVVNFFVDDGARAGRALLPLETKRRDSHAFNRRVEIGISVNNDGIFSAHLKNSALDPLLPRTVSSRALIDIETNFLRSGKSDKPGQRMLYQSGAKGAARAGAEVHHTVRHARFLQDLKEFGGDGRRIMRRLEHNRIAADNGGHGHARHNGAREVP